VIFIADRLQERGGPLLLRYFAAIPFWLSFS
jgi:hypothetical protein